MIEILLYWVVPVIVFISVVVGWCWFVASRGPSYVPPMPIPTIKPRPKATAVPDKKRRREFSVVYMNGVFRPGVMYREGNIMMDDGELFARLDQLVDKRVMSIHFKIER